MASITDDGKQLKRLHFFDLTGVRRAVRLGKKTDKQAESIKTKVETIIGDLIAGRPHDDEVSRWMRDLDPVLRKRLAKVGLLAGVGMARVTLKTLFEKFFNTSTVKSGTATTYRQASTHLAEHFGASREVRSVTNLDADEWRQAMKKQNLAEATISKRVKVARQIWKKAIRWKMAAENPFVEVKAGSQRNKKRAYFVSRDDAQKVLDACPDAQWRLIFALSRFGGMRCPSEHVELKWQHIDWERGRILIHSEKTEHLEDGETRWCPLFPELRPYLLDAFEQAEPGTEYVITRYRRRDTNMRTQLLRIIARAGLTPWPRLFHNLRATRETELCEDFPAHVVCAWIGNSEDVAFDHYLQVTDAHFEKAARGESKAAQKAAQQPAEGVGSREQKPEGENKNPPALPGDSRSCRSSQDVKVTPAGFEPASPP